MTAVREQDGWQLRESTSADIDELMTWFHDADSVNVWGGPRFRYPFTAQSFREDCHWPEMASCSLQDPAREFRAFGQFYDRNGRINLARLIVHPRYRRQGIGRRLLTSLMQVGRLRLPLDEYSLFVYRDNVPALHCYRLHGFEITDYPADQILADQCYYLTRPVQILDDADSSQ